MTVFVDEIKTYKSGRWCHMTADTDSELHEMASTIGLKHAWFQDHPTCSHYDLRPTKRVLAVQNGAMEVTWREQAVLLNRKRQGNGDGARFLDVVRNPAHKER